MSLSLFYGQIDMCILYRLYIHIDHCVANRFACVTSNWAILCVCVWGGEGGGVAAAPLHVSFLASLIMRVWKGKGAGRGRGRPVTMNFSWHTYANGMQHR